MLAVAAGESSGTAALVQAGLGVLTGSSVLKDDREETDMMKPLTSRMLLTHPRVWSD